MGGPTSLVIRVQSLRDNATGRGRGWLKERLSANDGINWILGWRYRRLNRRVNAARASKSSWPPLFPRIVITRTSEMPASNSAIKTFGHLVSRSNEFPVKVITRRVCRCLLISRVGSLIGRVYEIPRFPRLNYDSDESEKEPGVIYNGNNRSTVGLKNKLRA